MLVIGADTESRTPSPRETTVDAGTPAQWTGDRYRLLLRGRLDRRQLAGLDALSVETGDDGVTAVEGAIRDQAELHGLLARLRDLGIPLLAVIPVEVGPDATHHTQNGD